MTNKEICEKLNQLLPTLEVFEREEKLKGAQVCWFAERYIVANGVEVRVNVKINRAENWEHEDEIKHIAFRKDKREKLIEFLGGNHE